MYNKKKKKIKYPVMIILILLVLISTILFSEKKLNTYSKLKENVILIDSDLKNFITDSISIFSVKNQKEKIKKLTQELEQLKVEITKSKNQEEEINQIKNNLDIKKLESEYQVITSKVINRLPNSWYQEIIIDKGKKDNISVNDTVVTSKGVVGKIKKVKNNTSVVELITKVNKNYKVSGIITKDKTYYLTVNKYENNNFQGEGITNYDKVTPGDNIITTGFNFKKGFSLGTINKIINNTYNTGKIIFITPSVDFDNLTYVAVLKDKK